MAIRPRRKKKQEARGRLHVSKSGCGSYGGPGLIGHRVRDRQQAKHLLERGDITQSNFDELAHLLPKGQI